MGNNRSVNEGEGKKCFIITPIGDEESSTFRKARGVIESVIKPLLNEYGFDDVRPAYEINMSGTINTQIINGIIESDLVIANLTGNNPNVMYELCLRHVVAKPIIQICEKGTTLPFDIKDNRTIFFQNDMLGVNELRENMSLFLDEIDYTKEYEDNPIYNAYKLGNLLKETQGTEENGILNILISIWDEVAELKRNSINSDSALTGYKSIHGNEYHSVKDILLEIDEIDNETINKMITIIEKSKSFKIRVHELAKELEVSSTSILMVAEMVGMKLKSHSSFLSRDAVKKILDCIISIKKENE